MTNKTRFQQKTTPNEDLILGLDLGIASIGWAVIKDPALGGGIVAMGVRTFDVPETAKERTPTNQLRRQHRGLRRVLRRRRQRMRDLRKLFAEHDLIESRHPGIFGNASLDPWTLRAEGLDRKLKPEELAVTLAHIAKHRGFKSNSKRDQGKNAPDETSKMKSAIEATRAMMARPDGPAYRTVGEMFAKDPAFADRKRNRDGEFTRSILRDDQRNEVVQIFDKQRRMGSAVASADLESKFIGIAFHQRPLADSEDKVRMCLFEPAEKRASKISPSFELFRFYSRLATLRIKSAGETRGLTPQEIALAGKDFGSQNGMTFKRLRKLLDLDEGFDGISDLDEGKRDVVNRSVGNGCMRGTNALRLALGDSGWASIQKSDGLADRIAFVLTFREDLDSVKKGLEELGLEPLILDALMKGVREGSFTDFKGAGHVSAKGCRNIVPHLAQGLTYDKACERAGYNHANRPMSQLDDIANPIARKSITECLKQAKAIIETYGLPGRIHVELARDVGKSKDKRDEISRGLEKRNKERDKLAARFKELYKRDPRSDDLMRYELWEEQGGKCLYTNQDIHPDLLLSSDRSVEVDHILPWSRSGDDSFVNKTLCFAKANQDKKGRTPYEWLGADTARWETFVANVETNKAMKGRKKRNYLLKDASVLEEKFRSRNLNDTKYATKIAMELLAHRHYADDVRVVMKSGMESDKAAQRWFDGSPSIKGKVRVQSRPGALTSRLWRGWGLNAIMRKKDNAGRRASDDRHHALDALIVAATTASQVHRLTKAWQDSEKAGSHRDFSDLAPPWATFLDETRKHFTELFVSRAERRRARGEGHGATLLQIVEGEDGALVYERCKIEDLMPKDRKKWSPELIEKNLADLKDADRNSAVVQSLREWIIAGMPKDSPPRSPKGDIIKKVRIRATNEPGVFVREGAAKRGEMPRVDVFRKQSKKGKWEYFLVPIYPHQVMNEVGHPAPPNKAVAGNTPEEEWPDMKDGGEFMWSAYPASFLELEKSNGTFVEGYFRGLDRATGNIHLSNQLSNEVVIRSLGPRTLSAFRKYSIDRLGNRFEVVRETRTWHGKVCT